MTSIRAGVVDAAIVSAVVAIAVAFATYVAFELKDTNVELAQVNDHLISIQQILSKAPR